MAPRKPASIVWTGDNADAVTEFVGSDKIAVTGNIEEARRAAFQGGPPPEKQIELWNAAAHQWLPVPRGHHIVKGADGEAHAVAPDVLAALRP